MDGKERKEQIRRMILQSSDPITATKLAQHFGVSRQVIVQDVALLRAMGAALIATPSGYIGPRPANALRVLACTHQGTDRMRLELETIVDHGGIVRDVMVDHPVYGEYCGMLMLRNRADINEFIRRLDKAKAEPLASLTGGVHLHTVEADDTAALDAIEKALTEQGLLLDSLDS